jgi:hypothetical protein
MWMMKKLFLSSIAAAVGPDDSGACASSGRNLYLSPTRNASCVLTHRRGAVAEPVSLPWLSRNSVVPGFQADVPANPGRGRPVRRLRSRSSRAARSRLSMTMTLSGSNETLISNRSSRIGYLAHPAYRSRAPDACGLVVPDVKPDTD